MCLESGLRERGWCFKQWGGENSYWQQFRELQVNGETLRLSQGNVAERSAGNLPGQCQKYCGGAGRGGGCRGLEGGSEVSPPVVPVQEVQAGPEDHVEGWGEEVASLGVAVVDKEYCGKKNLEEILFLFRVADTGGVPGSVYGK